MTPSIELTISPYLNDPSRSDLSLTSFDIQNSRVKWWAIVQTVIVFSICALNVHVLKSWFEVKRVL